MIAKGGKNSVSKYGKKSLVEYSVPNISFIKGEFVNKKFIIIVGVENNNKITINITTTVIFHCKQFAVIGG